VQEAMKAYQSGDYQGAEQQDLLSHAGVIDFKKLQGL
jgi:hypothetical protein